MLAVLLNWIYIFVTTFCLGGGFAVLCGKLFRYRIKRMDSLLMAGVILATVYAQLFSFAGGVGMAANLLLAAVCALTAFLCRREMGEYIVRGWKAYGITKKILLPALILLWAFFTSRGYIHYDSDLYHGQSIRWIEEYGVVPGLGNLHERFAYNSSFFALSALYSMKFLTGESLHACNGFFALLLTLTALDITRSWKEKRFALSDFARVGAIYYLTTITNEVVSPASDYSIMCVVFFIVIKWLDLLAVEEKDIAPYSLLCVAGVYALTLKLTAGLILLLLIKPASRLIREKRGKEICLYLAMGLAVAVPWFARTVVISGWLVYPFPQLDLFDLDWKMDAAAIEVDAAQISAWGRALYDVARLDTPAAQWIPNWFATTLSAMEKILILGSALCIPLILVNAGYVFVKRRWKDLDILLVLGTLICCYLFWQFSAPLMRYGYAYVLLTDFLTVGWLLVRFNRKWLQQLVYFSLLLYGVYKVFALGGYIRGCWLQDYYVWQADYGAYELESYELGGYTFYKPVSGDRTGYDLFPAAPTQPDLELRGDGLEDGFRKK